MFNNRSSYIVFHPKHLKIFIGTLLGIFLIVSLQLFGVKSPRLIQPIAPDADYFFDVIQPKLEQIPNFYKLKPERSLIPKAGASEEYESTNAYILVDYKEGTIIAAKNLATPLPIASITKLMTAVVALDLAEPWEKFQVSKRAAALIPTKIGVRIGESFSLNELLQAALMTSANDAVEVIREGIDRKYNKQIFIKAMNGKAQAIGLKNSLFSNPQGFDNEQNFSTVEDLAILIHYALENYPEIAAIVKQDYLQLTADANHKKYDLYNWNGLIGVYPQILGVKIGNTGAAGKTTAVVSARDGKKLIAVVLGAPRIIERDLWAAQLLDLGYKNLYGLQPLKITETQLQEKYATWKYW